MKIGILTFHYGINYGGLFQAIALQQTLLKMRQDVEIINYVPSGSLKFKTWEKVGLHRNAFNIKSIASLNKICIKLKYASSIIRKFEIFRNKNLCMSAEVDENTLDSIITRYDTIIVGSDQVWGPSQHSKMIYFLNTYNGTKISYAVCCALNYIENKHREAIINALSSFKAISVRNQETFQFVKDLTNKNVPIVADPTVLFDFNKYIKTDKEKKNYILTYTLGKAIPGGHESVLKKIKEKYGNIPVYAIVIPVSNFETCPWADKVFYDVDPGKWLNLIVNATFIYTDSYHGVLFSLKFQKPFLAYYAEKLRASRFLDLGRRYKIENYIVSSPDEIELINSINKMPDFHLINAQIEKHKEESMNFLKSSLGF